MEQAARRWADVAIEELRIAGVMNGGVSLAVWMGGVAHEINRLSWSDPDADEGDAPACDYRSVLGLARTTVVVDVLAGTSAGGINGGALALAQVNAKADLSVLRSLWAEQGRMDNLLRKPFQGQPTSLLRGDDYFLPELARAMRSLVASYEPSGRSVELVMPTTLLTGSIRETPDSLGQLMLQSVHGAWLRFSFDPEDGDDGARGAPEADDLLKTAQQIALAARASASFPFAFEATYLPVDDPAHRADADLRPDLGRHASWHKEGVNRSRFAVDGGVLANTPTRHALEVIDRRRAEGAVRRAMLLVYPHAPHEMVEMPSTGTAAPTVAAGALDLFTAMRSTSSATFVEEIEQHNRRVSAWRTTRMDLLPGPGEAELRRLYALIGAGWPAYVGLRRRQSAQTLAAQLTYAGWSFERIRQQAELAQTGPVDPADPKPVPQLPYLPAEPPPDPSAIGEPTEWPWGTLVATGVADAVAEILRRALGVVTRDEESELGPVRKRVADLRTSIETIRERIDEPWDDPATRQMEPDLNYWRARLIAFRRAVRPGQPDSDRAELETLLPGDQAAPLRDLIMARHGECGADLAAAVREIADLLVEHLSTLRTIGEEERGKAAGLVDWLPLLTQPALEHEPEEESERILTRLLALDTATWLVASADTTGTNLPINLVQLSLGVQHDWARQSQSPDSKVAGMSLDRFGGFLKRSWRINDWIWGRLDAAHLLCQVVLDPARLRRIRAVVADDDPQIQAQGILARLGRLYGEDDPDVIAELPGYAEALAELVSLTTLAPDHAPPTQLPHVAAFACRPIQWRIILEELPLLAASVIADDVEGQNLRSRGNLFLRQNRALLDDLSDPTKVEAGWQSLGERALKAFDEAGIGREDLGIESGSDAIIQTAANAAAVGVTVLDSDELGVPAIKPFTRGLRGAALLPYWLIIGLTRGSSVARALALAGFAFGGVLLALGLLGVLGTWSSAAAGVGGATLLSAFAYSSLRTGSLLHGVVLLAAAVPLAAYVLDQEHADQDAHRAVVTVFVLSGVALALVLLGSLPWPLASPFATSASLWQRSMDSPRVRWRVVGVLGAIAGALLLTAFVNSAWARRELWDPLFDQHWISSHPIRASWGAAALLVLAGGRAAYQLGRSMRLWRRSADGTAELENVTNPAGVAASWAAVYGTGALVLGVFLSLSIADARRHDRLMCDFGARADGCTPVYEYATAIWLGVLGVALISVVPSVIIAVHRRALRAKLRSDPSVPALAAEAELVELLLSRDRAFRYLVKDLTAPSLTGAGRRLLTTLQEARVERALSATAPGGATTQASGT